MKRLLAILAVVMAMTAFAPIAEAGHRYYYRPHHHSGFSISVGPSYYGSPYYYRRPSYYYTPPVYYSAPAYYGYQPYYYPRPYVRYYRHCW
jgi:hypothetical protein